MVIICDFLYGFQFTVNSIVHYLLVLARFGFKEDSIHYKLS